MPYVIYNSIEVHYNIKGNGEPLLFLHGNSGSSLYFNEEANLLAKRFKVILIDYPGHGKSERLTSFPLNFWEYNARCALELLDYLNIDKTFVISVGGGALVAFNMALLEPKKIKKIVIDNFPGEFLSSEDVERILEKRREALKYKGRYFYERMHGKDFMDILNNDEKLLCDVAEKKLQILLDDISKISIPALFCSDMTEPDFDYSIEKTLKASEKIKHSIVMYYSDRKFDPSLTFVNMAFNFFKNKNIDHLISLKKQA